MRRTGRHAEPTDEEDGYHPPSRLARQRWWPQSPPAAARIIRITTRVLPALACMGMDRAPPTAVVGKIAAQCLAGEPPLPVSSIFRN
ncbi:MAG: hypothetical protein IPG64_19355 [Haliea sp.]|nr:hypothetical protein [Haliea sp.]